MADDYASGNSKSALVVGMAASKFISGGERAQQRRAAISIDPTFLDATRGNYSNHGIAHRVATASNATVIPQNMFTALEDIQKAGLSYHQEALKEAYKNLDEKADKEQLLKVIRNVVHKASDKKNNESAGDILRDHFDELPDKLKESNPEESKALNNLFDALNLQQEEAKLIAEYMKNKDKIASADRVIFERAIYSVRLLALQKKDDPNANGKAIQYFKDIRKEIEKEHEDEIEWNISISNINEIQKNLIDEIDLTADMADKIHQAAENTRVEGAMPLIPNCKTAYLALGLGIVGLGLTTGTAIAFGVDPLLPTVTAFAVAGVDISSALSDIVLNRMDKGAPLMKVLPAPISGRIYEEACSFAADPTDKLRKLSKGDAIPFNWKEKKPSKKEKEYFDKIIEKHGVSIEHEYKDDFYKVYKSLVDSIEMRGLSESQKVNLAKSLATGKAEVAGELYGLVNDMNKFGEEVQQLVSMMDKYTEEDKNNTFTLDFYEQELREKYVAIAEHSRRIEGRLSKPGNSDITRLRAGVDKMVTDVTKNCELSKRRFEECSDLRKQGKTDEFDRRRIALKDHSNRLGIKFWAPLILSAVSVLAALASIALTIAFPPALPIAIISSAICAVSLGMGIHSIYKHLDGHFGFNISKVFDSNSVLHRVAVGASEAFSWLKSKWLDLKDSVKSFAKDTAENFVENTDVLERGLDSAFSDEPKKDHEGAEFDGTGGVDMKEHIFDGDTGPPSETSAFSFGTIADADEVEESTTPSPGPSSPGPSSPGPSSPGPSSPGPSSPGTSSTSGRGMRSST